MSAARTRRLLALALGVLTALAGLQVVAAGPAAAGQLGLTIEIRGAAKVTVIEGTVEDGASKVCDFRHSLDDRVVNTCPRIRSSAVFSAVVWLRIEVAQSDTDEWRPDNWDGCTSVRQVEGDQFDCKVESEAFSSTEKTVRASAYDATPPEMTSWTQRRSTTQDLTSTYEFAATQGDFECSVDHAATFFPCTSPWTHTWPSPGQHRFLVRAYDLSRNTTGVKNLDDTHLDTYVRTAPPAQSASRTARFVVDAPSATALQCSLDGAAYAFCGTPGQPFELTGLVNGPHELRVYAANQVSRDELPAVHRWEVGVFPETQLDGVTLLGRTAQLTFSSPDGGVGFSCRLTGPGEPASDWLGCQSPVTLSDLPDGDFTFEVRAHDATGAPDPSPATHDFTVRGPVDPGPVDPGPVDPAPALPRTAKVVKVVDADTLVLRAGTRTFRADLAGLVSPSKPRCVVRRARTTLARAARPGAVVRLVALPASRATGTSPWTVLRGRTDLGRAQLQKGLARYDRREAPASRRTAYAAAQRQARRAHRGLWGRC